MTLRLIFPGVKYPGIEPGILPGEQASTILVTGAPDEDPELAERFARAVLQAGVCTPRMGRLSWDELVAAGLEAGILERAKTQ